MKLFTIIPIAAALAFGQGGFQPPKGPTPRTADGKPDFSGVWQHPFVPDMTKDAPNQKGLAELPFTEWGATEWKNYHAEDGDYTGVCLPFGLPRSMNSPDPIQILQSPKYVAFLFEQSTWFHVVPIDGRDHRKQIATWFGDSIGAGKATRWWSIPSISTATRAWTRLAIRTATNST